jgi:trk system potassium uptake protein TrkH
MLTGTLFVSLTLISWFLFLTYDYNPVDSLYEVVSAVATVGLSSGITSTDLPLLLKGVLCVDMIAGRVEVLALLYLFYPGAWFGHRNHEH